MKMNCMPENMTVISTIIKCYIKKKKLINMEFILNFN